MQYGMQKEKNEFKSFRKILNNSGSVENCKQDISGKLVDTCAISTGLSSIKTILSTSKFNFFDISLMCFDFTSYDDLTDTKSS